MPYLTETKLKQEELEKMIFLVFENTCTSAKDIVEQVTEYVRGYDVDEEVSLYATSLGKNGVPATFKDLLKDMNEAKRMWTQLAKNLKKLK